MNKLIITMQIGRKGKDIWRLCTPYIERYAERIGADFKIHTEAQDRFKDLSFYLNKFGMLQWFPKYEQILMIDSDVFITPDAPNIFIDHPDTDTFYGVDESYTDRAHIVQPYIDKYKIDWELSEYGTPKHYNGGVWIIGNKCDMTYYLDEYL